VDKNCDGIFILINVIKSLNTTRRTIAVMTIVVLVEMIKSLNCHQWTTVVMGLLVAERAEQVAGPSSVDNTSDGAHGCCAELLGNKI
jgi:hypothetical protein